MSAELFFMIFQWVLVAIWIGFCVISEPLSGDELVERSCCVAFTVVGAIVLTLVYFFD